MAEVALSIGGAAHHVACRDGEEARLEALGRMIDERWPAALRAAGGLNNERAMLFVALMLADDLDESERRPPAGAAVSDTTLDKLAGQLESLADALEQAPTTA